MTKIKKTVKLSSADEAPEKPGRSDTAGKELLWETAGQFPSTRRSHSCTACTAGHLPLPQGDETTCPQRPVHKFTASSPTSCHGSCPPAFRRWMAMLRAASCGNTAPQLQGTTDWPTWPPGRSARKLGCMQSAPPEGDRLSPFGEHSCNEEMIGKEDGGGSASGHRGTQRRGRWTQGLGGSLARKERAR